MLTICFISIKLQLLYKNVCKNILLLLYYYYNIYFIFYPKCMHYALFYLYVYNLFKSWKTKTVLHVKNSSVQSKHVSLNVNELLLTLPLSSIFCVLGRRITMKKKLIHCILHGSDVGRKLRLFYTFISSYKTTALLVIVVATAAQTQRQFNSIQFYLYSAFHETIFAKQLYRKLSFFNRCIYV